MIVNSSHFLTSIFSENENKKFKSQIDCIIIHQGNMKALLFMKAAPNRQNF